MKYNLTVLYAAGLLTTALAIHSCKKDNKSDLTQQYKNLKPDIAMVAKWYDKQASDNTDRQVAKQNNITWERTVKVRMPDNSFIYAVPILHNDSISRELIISRQGETTFQGLVKQYKWSKSPTVLILEIQTLKGELIEEGYFNKEGQYIKTYPIRRNSKLMTKPRPGNKKKSEGGEEEDKEGTHIGVTGGGDPIVVITAPGGSPFPIFVPSVPASMPPPDKPADPKRYR